MSVYNISDVQLAVLERKHNKLVEEHNTMQTDLDNVSKKELDFEYLENQEIVPKGKRVCC